jgi:hypothetical protein
MRVVRTPTFQNGGSEKKGIRVNVVVAVLNSPPPPHSTSLLCVFYYSNGIGGLHAMKMKIKTKVVYEKYQLTGPVDVCVTHDRAPTSRSFAQG